MTELIKLLNMIIRIDYIIFTVLDSVLFETQCSLDSAIFSRLGDFRLSTLSDSVFSRPSVSQA